MASSQSTYSEEAEEDDEEADNNDDHALSLRRRLARTDEKDRQTYIQVKRRWKAGIQEDFESSYDESTESIDEPKPKSR